MGSQWIERPKPPSLQFILSHNRHGLPPYEPVAPPPEGHFLSAPITPSPQDLNDLDTATYESVKRMVSGIESLRVNPAATGISTPAMATTVDFSSICRRGMRTMASSLQRGLTWRLAASKFWSLLASATATTPTQPEATPPGRSVDGETRCSG